MKNLLCAMPLLIFVLVLAGLPRTRAFVGTKHVCTTSVGHRQHVPSVLFAQQGDVEEEPNVDESKEEGEEESISEADARLSDIIPPAVSFSRNSILFSENPTTQRNNDLLTFWRGMKSVVPPVITGAWPWRDPHFADEAPMGAFYNIFFVRMPVIVMGCIYANNLREEHPLIMDYGDGPFAVPPLLVFGVLALVLA